MLCHSTPYLRACETALTSGEARDRSQLRLVRDGSGNGGTRAGAEPLRVRGDAVGHAQLAEQRGGQRLVVVLPHADEELRPARVPGGWFYLTPVRSSGPLVFLEAAHGEAHAQRIR